MTSSCDPFEGKGDIHITDGYGLEPVQAIEYEDKMGSDARVVDAARVSFNKSHDNYTDEQNESLIRYLAKHDHFTPFTHCFMTVKAMAPISIARQFMKHTQGFAWNEVSRRYVDDPPVFFVPDSFRKRPDNMKQGSVEEDSVPVEGAVLEEVLRHANEARAEYRSMLVKGVCPEQARFFLPQSTITEWYWTASVSGWARMINLRSDKHAQQECHVYAYCMRVLMETHFPLCAKYLLK